MPPSRVASTRCAFVRSALTSQSGRSGTVVHLQWSRGWTRLFKIRLLSCHRPPRSCLNVTNLNSNQMLAQRLRLPLPCNWSSVGSEMAMTSSMFLQWVVVEQHPLESPGSSRNVVRRYVPMCPRGWISSPPSAAALQVDGRRSLVDLEDRAKSGAQAIYFQRQRRLRRA